MSNNDWYSDNGWYTTDVPAPETEKASPQVEQRPVKKKNRTKLWMIISSVLLLVLIAVSSIAFGDWGNENSPAEPPQELPSLNPFAPFDPMPPQTDEDGKLPDSWEEYFESFYTPAQKNVAEINIPRAKLPINCPMELSEATETELSLSALYEKCSPSVVGIRGYHEGKQGYYWGTGIILTSDGLILTNTHVIDECDSATVVLSDNSEYEALLVGADSISDLAVLKIDGSGLPAAEFGSSTSLTVGDSVAAIGNPLGETFRFTLTNGIISAIDRGINYNGHTMTLLQTNTALNEGNSGGPLFNMYGQVIGITNMKMMSSYSSIEGIGFAIPSSTVSAVVNDLVQYGEVKGRPSIGITVAGIAEEQAELYDMPVGLYVSEVSEGSDAEEQGIRPGDIITAVNGENCNTTERVAEIKNALQVGDTIAFTVWRDGKTFDVTVTLMDTNEIYK